MAWVETQSQSFTARHASEDANSAMSLLDRLERFRDELSELFETTPGEVSAVIHSHDWQLALAHPWLPLARMVAAPASRRYFAGWFSAREIHVLAPPALERRASGLPESAAALERSPLHEYAHLVIGANNPGLPPPFRPNSFARYVRWAWLCEGAATHFAGQTRLLRPAILRRLREGGRPAFPPSARDAQLLGGTLFALLEDRRGTEACVRLACRLDGNGRGALERAFDRPALEIEGEWRAYLGAFTSAPPQTPS